MRKYLNFEEVKIVTTKHIEKLISENSFYGTSVDTWYGKQNIFTVAAECQ